MLHCFVQDACDQSFKSISGAGQFITQAQWSFHNYSGALPPYLLTVFRGLNSTGALIMSSVNVKIPAEMKPASMTKPGYYYG